METDEQLVELALGGSTAAFGGLVLRYEERLLRFLLTRCACRADAEDALQDTFLNAYRYLPSYNPRWRFSTWLYRIAIRNAAGQQDRRTELFDDSSYEHHGADESLDPLTVCIMESETENVWLAAKRLLPADTRAALWLRYVEDMSIRDIARALDRSQAWTKVTLLRARRRLARDLAQEVRSESESKAYG